MTNNLTSVIKYKNSDRANFQAWRRTLSAALSTHPDKLLTIVTEKELAKSVLIKYKDADASDLVIIRDEADTAAWHIFVASIEDPTTLAALEREYLKNGQPCKDSSHLAYTELCERWELGSKTNALSMAARADKLNDDRDKYMNAGAKSGSHAHMVEFVEGYLTLCAELENTDYKHSDPVKVNTTIKALQTHEPTFVAGFMGQKAGDPNWKKDFNKFFTELKAQLESLDQTRNSTNGRTDALATKTEASEYSKLIDAITILTTKVNRLESRGTGTSTGGFDDMPTCKHCNSKHYPNREFECLGMAVATGKLSAKDAEKYFSRSNDKTRSVQATVDKYKAAQSPKPIAKVPEKTVHLMVKTEAIVVDAGACPLPAPPAPGEAQGEALGGVTVPPAHKNYSSGLSWAPPSDHMNDAESSGLPVGFTVSDGTLQAGVPEPVSQAPVHAPFSNDTSKGLVDSITLATSNDSAMGQNDDTLLWDTQGMDTIFNNVAYFPDGVDATRSLQILTMVPGEVKGRTEGMGTAVFYTATGQRVTIKDAHLYADGTHNIVATRKVNASIVDNVCMRCADGVDIAFDAGYFTTHILPQAPVRQSTTPKFGSEPNPNLGLYFAGLAPGADPVFFETPSTTDIARDPDVVSAMLATGLAHGIDAPPSLGDVTRGPRTTAGVRDMNVGEVAVRMHMRTDLSPDNIRALPETTDAPKVLSKIEKGLPVFDYDSLRANADKQPAKAHGSTRTRTISFDLQGPFTASKHGNNRYAMIFHAQHDKHDKKGKGERESKKKAYAYFMTDKGKAPERLNEFLIDFMAEGNDVRKWQLYTDNEIVLNPSS